MEKEPNLLPGPHTAAVTSIGRAQRWKTGVARPVNQPGNPRCPQTGRSGANTEQKPIHPPLSMLSLAG